MAKDIKKKPSDKATSLKIERSGNSFSGSWKLPSKATNDNNESRWSKTRVRWVLDVSDSKDNPVDLEAALSADTTSNSQNYSEFKGNWGKVWKGKPLSREAVYPVQKGGETGKKISGLVLSVRGENKCGNGDWVSARYNFVLPKAPSVELEYDDATARMKWRIKSDKGEGNAERYDTRYRVRYRVWYKSTGKWGGWSILTTWTASKKTDLSGGDDIDYFRTSKGINFATGNMVEYLVEAYARGAKGDNPAKDNPVTKRMTIRYPGEGGIKTITCTSKNSYGRVLLNINSPFYNKKKKTDNTIAQAQVSVSLQRLKDRPASDKRSDINMVPDSEWQSVEGAVNDGNVEWLYDQYPNAVSTPGTYTWYRLKNEMFGWITYCTPVRADKLFKEAIPEPSAEDDRAYIHTITPGDDGTSAKVVVGWKENNANTGTELSWSTSAHAWESVKGPELFEFIWKDKTKAASKYTDSGTVYLEGLTEGETYYVRARRYLDGNKKSYGIYSEIAEVTPVTRPEEVVLEAPAAVRRGEDIELSWTFTSNMPQTRWVLHQQGKPNVAFAGREGNDAKGSTIVPATAYESLSELKLFVSVSTGGNPTDSNVVTVAINEPPTCEAAMQETITEQPVSLEVYSDTNTAVILCTAKSRPVTFEQPDGDATQLPGDVIVSDSTERGEINWIQVSWNSTLLYSQLTSMTASLQQDLTDAQAALDELQPSDEGYDDALAARDNAQIALDANLDAIAAHAGDVFKADLTLDTGLELVDRGKYDFEVAVKDYMTQMVSAVWSCTAQVNWAHKAPEPSDAILLTANAQEKSVRIALAVPDGAIESDRYDIYRKVPGGYVLAAAELGLDDVVTDQYAPYAMKAELAYRICVRTADGDLSFYDYPYELRASGLRIDFASEFVELPLNVVVNDSSEKSFESRGHFGRIDEAGYWDSPVTKTASYKSDTFKTDNAELLATIERLSNYPGACFVRTPDGQAFACNVDVTTSKSYDSEAVEVSLAITKVRLSDEYMIMKPGAEQ